MMNRLREWGLPVGLLLLWGIAAAYTLSALIGMDARLQATQRICKLVHSRGHDDNLFRKDSRPASNQR